MSDAPPISIVIRTSNSERPLRRLLRRLKLGPADEVVIVDTASRDGTVALAENAGATIVPNPGAFNYSRTLNLGFAAAKNEWLLALSSHCVPVNPEFLGYYREAIGAFADRPAVIYGLQFYSRLEYERIDKAPKSYSGSGPENQVPHAGNMNALYARDAWTIHPFVETLPTGEDLEWKNWAAQAGLMSIRAPKAAVYYFHLGGIRYRFKKGWDEASIGGPQACPMTVSQLSLGMAHATRHLLVASRALRPWMGQMAHQAGAFFASQRGRRS